MLSVLVLWSQLDVFPHWQWTKCIALTVTLNSKFTILKKQKQNKNKNKTKQKKTKQKLKFVSNGALKLLFEPTGLLKIGDGF